MWKEGCYRGPRVLFGSRKAPGETPYRQEQGSVQRSAGVSDSERRRS